MPAAPRHTCILSTQRSGTTLLESFMDSNPHLVAAHEVLLDIAWGLRWCYWSWLAERVKADPQAIRPNGPRIAANFIDFLADLQSDKADAQGVAFDVKYDQIHMLDPEQEEGRPPFLVRMVWHNSWGVIHLVRRNTLAVHVSGLVAKARAEEGHLKYDSRFTGKVTVPTDGLVAALEAQEHAHARARAWFDGHPAYLPLYYEDLMDGPRVSPAVGARIAEFLGIPDAFCYDPRTVKVSPLLRDAIANLNEVEACLAGTRFQAMLTWP